MAVNQRPAKPTRIQDLDMDTIVTTERHDKDFTDLDTRLCDIENKFGNNEKIALTLTDAAENAVKMQTLVCNLFIKALKQDDNVKQAINDVIDIADRNAVRKLIKRVGLAGAAIIISLISIIGTILVTNFIGNLGSRETMQVESPAKEIRNSNNGNR